MALFLTLYVHAQKMQEKPKGGTSCKNSTIAALRSSAKVGIVVTTIPKLWNEPKVCATADQQQIRLSQFVELLWLPWNQETMVIENISKDGEFNMQQIGKQS